MHLASSSLYYQVRLLGADSKYKSDTDPKAALEVTARALGLTHRRIDVREREREKQREKFELGSVRRQMLPWTSSSPLQYYLLVRSYKKAEINNLGETLVSRRRGELVKWVTVFSCVGPSGARS